MDTQPPAEDGPHVGETAQAASDPDGLLTPDFASEFWPPELKAIGSAFSTAGSYYSKAKTGYDVIKFGLQALGILDPPDPDAQFKALEANMERLVSAADVHNTELFIDSLRGEADWAVDRIKIAGGTLMEGGNEDQSSGHAVDTITQPDDAAFYRVNNPNATKGLWQSVVPDRPGDDDKRLGVDGETLVYDWRLGAPALLELVAKRIAVIAAMDHNFRWDRRYDDQLRKYRAAIQRNYDKMLSGIRCNAEEIVGNTLGLGEMCADIYTGAYAWEDSGDNFPRFLTADEQNQVLQLLKSQVIRGMPLFEMKQMIDLLTLFIDGKQDLTETNDEIRVSTAPGFCLDVQWGNPAPGTPVWIWWCNAGNAQYWNYNRDSGLIRNDAFNGCLDVLPRQTWFPDQIFTPTLGLKDGSGVVINSCDGTGGQKWTYDPDTETIQNAFGMVLNMAGPPTAQTMVNVVAGPPSGLPAQRWLDVQRPIGKRAGLLWRTAAGELRVWEMLSGWRYRSDTIGSADPSWQVIGTGDLDGDGHGDVLWRNSNLLSEWNLKSTSPVTMTPATANAQPSIPLVGDFDGDGVSDLLWNWVDTIVVPNTTIHIYGATSWFMNPQSTTPRSASAFTSQVDRVVALGNFDGDAGHHADEIRMRTDGTLTIALSTGSSASFDIGGVSGGWTVAGVGDFNGDGTDDILMFDTVNSDVTISPIVAGRMTPGVILGNVPASSGWALQGIADADGDGISDIVWRHGPTGTVSFWMMNSATSIREYTSLSIPPNITFNGTIVLGPPR